MEHLHNLMNEVKKGVPQIEMQPPSAVYPKEQFSFQLRLPQCKTQDINAVKQDIRATFVIDNQIRNLDFKLQGCVQLQDNDKWADLTVEAPNEHVDCKTKLEGILRMWYKGMYVDSIPVTIVSHKITTPQLDQQGDSVELTSDSVGMTTVIWYKDNAGSQAKGVQYLFDIEPAPAKTIEPSQFCASLLYAKANNVGPTLVHDQSILRSKFMRQPGPATNKYIVQFFVDQVSRAHQSKKFLFSLSVVDDFSISTSITKHPVLVLSKKTKHTHAQKVNQKKRKPTPTAARAPPKIPPPTAVSYSVPQPSQDSPPQSKRKIDTQPATIDLLQKLEWEPVLSISVIDGRPKTLRQCPSCKWATTDDVSSTVDRHSPQCALAAVLKPYQRTPIPANLPRLRLSPTPSRRVALDPQDMPSEQVIKSESDAGHASHGLSNLLEAVACAQLQ
mmetsp:Transcript_10792/g.20490  ORF Transcript_10792/g.20490 Transcript_10792/m.20490 type:complete len:444 (+) Transcript_10792:92-1423(+)